MAGREEVPMDQETFDRVLAEELGKGTDRRIAEGRARAAALKEYRKKHGIQPEPPRRVGQPPAGAAAVRTAPPPTGRAPAPKPGAADKHRLLALVQPEGIQRVQREQGDRVNVFPHLLIEEFVAMMIVLGFLVVYST